MSSASRIAQVSLLTIAGFTIAISWLLAGTGFVFRDPVLFFGGLVGIVGGYLMFRGAGV